MSASDQKEIEPEQLERAIAIASNLLSYRPRSRHELQQALTRKRIDPSIIQTALDQLEEHRLIDDHRFAQAWMEDRMRFRHRSRLRIKLELQQKGIESWIIGEVLGQYNDERESQVVKDLVESRGLNQKYPDRQQLDRYLAGQGFSSAAVRRVCSDYFN